MAIAIEGAVLIAAMAGPAAAQAQAQRTGQSGNPAVFSLPEPTPSPSATPAAQGPADERAGVRISPRVIAPSERAGAPSPAAPRAQTPAEARAQTPASAATVQPSSTDRTTSAPADQPASVSPGAGDQPAPAPSPPDQSPEQAPEAQIEYMLGEDDWVDVPPEPAITSQQQTPSGTAPRTPASPRAAPYGFWLWAALLAGLAALALAGVTLMRRRARNRAPLLLESDLARGLRQHLSASFGDAQDGTASPPPQPPRPRPQPAAQPDAQPATQGAAQGAATLATPEPATAAPRPAPPKAVAQPVQEPVREPVRLALSLAIDAARRSVMMFTLDYRLTLANRADRAVRDLALSARLVSAQRGASNAAPLALGQPIGQIERIGPGQSVSLAGTLQLPMRDVRMIRQGSVPVFIPLLHVTLEGAGVRAHTTSFVIGTPSGANHSRLHPIALDGPPGGIANLRANRIKAPAPSEAA